MQRTVEEKYKYNQSRNGYFADGYCIGVDLYRNYVKMDEAGKKSVCRCIDSFMRSAKKGDESCKGIIAGYRDAANDRKKRQNRLPY